MNKKGFIYRAIRKIYRLFFKRFYTKWKQDREQRRLNEGIVHRTYDVRELFFQENSPAGFNRYDMIVRLLAIENQYGHNNYGWDMYRRMQRSRKAEHWEVAEERFKTLIDSWDLNGYDESSEITLFKNLHWEDGSHRMALSIYHRHYTISCSVLPYSRNVKYGLETFIEYGFTISEINILKNRYESLCKELVVPFVCTLWSPAQEYFDEITERLALVANVKEYKDYEFDEFNYAQMVRKIYAVDDIEKWKIEKKIEYMKSSHPSWKMRKVLLEVDYPSFRMKASNQNTLSERCEVLKKIIRNDYLNKIPNYFHDIIMHIGDNFYQNEYINLLFGIDKHFVKDVFKSIKNYDYVVSKFDVPYQSAAFPDDYPLGKDIDMWCSEEHFTSIISAIIDTLKSKKTNYSIRIDVKNKYRQQVRLELYNQLIYAFDVFQLDPQIASVVLNERQQKGIVFVCSPRFEILARLLEAYANPEKRHHIQYIIDHKEDIDMKLCSENLPHNVMTVLATIESISSSIKMSQEVGKQQDVNISGGVNRWLLAV